MIDVAAGWAASAAEVPSQEQGEFAEGAIDVARADGQDGIARASFAQQIVDALLQGAAIDDILVAGGANGVGQRRGGDAADGRFAGGVDVGQDQHVGLIEGAAEIVPKVLRARVAMRLKEHQQAVVAAAARRFERGANFHRVMAVIVDQGNAAQRCP